jgi:hypothetical protein
MRSLVVRTDSLVAMDSTLACPQNRVTESFGRTVVAPPRAIL